MSKKNDLWTAMVKAILEYELHGLDENSDPNDIREYLKSRHLNVIWSVRKQDSQIGKFFTVRATSDISDKAFNYVAGIHT